MKQNVFAKVLTAVVIATSFSPAVAFADTAANSQMWVDCYNLPQPGKLYPGAVNQEMIWIAAANMSDTKPLKVSKIGVKLTGTAQPSDFTKVSFFTVDNNGNPINLPSTTFNSSGVAEITGSPLFNIPVGWTRDIRVAVDVSPSAAQGLTANFDVSSANFDYITTTPPSYVTLGWSYCTGTTFTIGPVPAPTTLTFDMVQPNGGEVWTIGQRMSVKWAATNMPIGSYFCKVELWKGGSLLTPVRNMSSGYLVQGIAWVVGASAATGGIVDPVVVPGSNYKMKAYMCNSAGTVIKVATSAANFRIKN